MAEHLYTCPNGHRWSTPERETPLVNIKCPDCSKTAVWHVHPLRRLEADVPPAPGSGEKGRGERPAV